MSLFQALHAKLENAETYKIIATRSGENLIVTLSSTINGDTPFTVTASPEELDAEFHEALETVIESKMSIKEEAAKAAEEAKERAKKAKKDNTSKSSTTSSKAKPSKPKEAWETALLSIKENIDDKNEDSMRNGIKKLKASSFFKDRKEYQILADELKKKVLSMKPSLL